MLTSEGSLALARAVSAGAKLVIRGAQLCNVNNAQVMATVEDVAKLTYAKLDGYAVQGALMTCTSHLPSAVDVTGEETGRYVSALDLEFTYMPNDAIEYNTVAVLADMYYSVNDFKFNTTYNAGAVVRYSLGNSTMYYQARHYISNTYLAPSNDLDNWNSVTVVSAPSPYVGDGYVMVTDTPVLLYVSRTVSPIHISSQMEIDYKVRIYIDNPVNTIIDKFVVFDTIGPEFSATAQIDLLAEFATSLRAIRDIASSALGV